jgi:hypothetical protein
MTGYLEYRPSAKAKSSLVLGGKSYTKRIARNSHYRRFGNHSFPSQKGNGDGVQTAHSTTDLVPILAKKKYL